MRSMVGRMGGCVMNGFTLRLVGLAAAFSLAAVSWFGLVAASLDTPADARPVKSCQEDDPCWNCHTMGNQICGPHNHRLHRR